MRAGQLRHRVTIQRIQEAQDAGGYEQQTPKDVATVWASVMAVSGNEYKRGIQVEAGITTIVEMRYRAGVTPGMRIKHDDRLLNIERAVDPEGRRIRLVCQCKEAVSA